MTEPEVRFATCRACGCTTLDTPVGLLNPQALPLGPYDRHGGYSATGKGHFLHRCPPPKGAA